MLAVRQCSCTIPSHTATDGTQEMFQSQEIIACCDIFAHYACVADCAYAMADAWEDTAGCAHADSLHKNVVKC